jgi:hypothetical protein
MTDPASGHEIAGDASIDADQVSALGIDDHDQSVTMSESVAAGSTSAADEDPSISTNFNVDEEDDDSTTTRGHHRSHRKRQRVDFPLSQTHDWISGDPPRQRGKRKCKVCQKQFSSAMNAQGWKIHLSKQHQITASMSSQSSPNAVPRTGQQQTIFKNSTSVLPQYVLQKYENAVIDYIIGGDLSLRAAGEPRFCNLVETLTNGCYKPPSTRTILRRTVELFNIAQPLLGNFLSSLHSCVSLTMDGWSNRNLKGFYVVTAHWIDTTSGSMKSVLLTILDVASGTGVGNHVGSALFAYLVDKVGISFLSRLLYVVTDNGSDACAAVTRLFHLINIHVGSKVLLPSNHNSCARIFISQN